MSYNKLAKYNVKVSCGCSNPPMSETYTLYAENNIMAKKNAIDIFHIAYEDLLCEYDAVLKAEVLNKDADKIKLPTYRYKVRYTIREVVYTSGYVYVDAEDSDDAAQYVIDYIDDPSKDICNKRIDDLAQNSPVGDLEVEIDEIFITDKDGNEVCVYH